jgi:hypothetical protein
MGIWLQMWARSGSTKCKLGELSAESQSIPLVSIIFENRVRSCHLLQKARAFPNSLCALAHCARDADRLICRQEFKAQAAPD